MRFKCGTKIFTSNGMQVGTLDRIVIEPNTREITHLVVQKGSLFTRDKVIPMELFDATTEDHITLHEMIEDPGEFPDFQESHYVPASRENIPAKVSAQYIRTVYWYPPLENTDGYFIYAVLSHIQKQHNGKEGRNSKGELVVLAEGANVICSNGKHVGNVECIYINPRQNQATHILITDELLLKEKKLIPTRWLTDVFKQEIHLSVDSELLASLPEYQIQT